MPDDRCGEPSFGQVKTDKDLRVWVTHTNSFNKKSEVRHLPGTAGDRAAPIKVLRGAIPVLGGGTITLTHAFGIAPTDHSEYLWISEPDNHRVLRVRGRCRTIRWST